MRHELKTWPVHFRDVIQPNRNKRKMVEIRKDDRTFKAGDVLHLQEFSPDREEYTGCWADVLVSHCLRDQPFVPEGYVALSIHLLDFEI